ncbi:MAG TPA: NUDIX domain-containing protein [Glaciihabitans sp.]|jgi:8-oxo-dGTP pyrophosphatase MutT (NUDIX family)|nr:NUDIX domain-containing protein [Glaciihabitans sp.]
MPITVAGARRTVEAVNPRSDAETQVRAHTLDYLHTADSAALDRTLPEHVTASAVILNTEHTHTLLVFHRKANFWVQPGGHLDEADDTVQQAALREAEEETGLRGLTVARDQPLDIERQLLGSGFTACRWHLDLAFLVLANRHNPLTVNAESKAVQWWPLDELPEGLAPGLRDRLRHASTVVPTVFTQ